MQQNQLGDDLDDLLVDVSGDAAVDIIRSMQLTSVTILADEHGGSDPFAVFEYALDQQYIDVYASFSCVLLSRRQSRQSRQQSHRSRRQSRRPRAQPLRRPRRRRGRRAPRR